MEVQAAEVRARREEEAAGELSHRACSARAAGRTGRERKRGRGTAVVLLVLAVGLRRKAGTPLALVVRDTTAGR